MGRNERREVQRTGKGFAMKTDRELLEMAAKAAGYKVHFALMEQRAIASPDAVALALSEPGNTWWNPLDDDGDALRLAVKLRLDVKQWNSLAIAANSWDKHAEENTSTQCPYAATRRAIVRVAAKLGEAMP